MTHSPTTTSLHRQKEVHKAIASPLLDTALCMNVGFCQKKANLAAALCASELPTHSLPNSSIIHSVKCFRNGRDVGLADAVQLIECTLAN